MADEIEFDLETGEEVAAKAKPETEDDASTTQTDDDTSTSQSTASDDDHQPDDHGDTELNEAEDDDEREAIRARRREERKNRKNAQREREDTLRRELAARDSIINELRSKVDLIEKRNSGSELAQLENEKKRVAQHYAQFKDQIRIATEAGNGAAVADATEKMFQAQRKFDELTNYEKALKTQQPQQPALDPRIANHAQDWMKRNPWYNFNNTDADSKLVSFLDRQLGEEGWDSTTPAYWQELDSRVSKYLPHRKNNAKVVSNKPRSVVTGAGRETASTPNANTYKLSAERVEALKDAGVWDDPKKRADAIKRFRDYDKQNKA